MTSSYRYRLLAALLWVLLTGTTDAQQANVQQASGDSPTTPVRASHSTRIAIIYTDFFYDPNNGISRLVNSIKGLDQEFQARKTDLRRLQQRIEQLTKETNEPAPGSSPLTVQTKLNELEQVKRDSQRLVEDTQTEYGNRLLKAIKPILEDLEQAIKTFAQQYGIDLILDGSKMDESLLYMSQGLDLTQAFIANFNRANAFPGGPEAKESDVSVPQCHT